VSTKTKPRSTGPAEPSTSRRRARPGARVPALGYASVPASFALDGPEVDAQRKAIEHGCRELGLELIDVVRDHEPEDSAANRRPGLLYALERIDAGEAGCLIVSDLERLSVSAGELDTVLDRLQKDERRLVALNVGLDTHAAAGQLAVATRPGVRPSPEPELELRPVPAAAEGAPETPVPKVGPSSQKATRALGYASVPADDDPENVARLERQKRSIERTCERLGLELVEVVREREPKAGNALERAGVSYLIERLAAGDASCLVVSGLERLSRSVSELGTLVQWLERSDVRLVAVDLDLDTLSPGGRAAARALASVGGWERERLSERTRKGLAAARARRRTGSASSPDWAAIRKRIAVMRADGMTLQAIADTLNEERVPTPRGGLKWRPSSVQSAAGYKRRSRAKSVTDLPSMEEGPSSSEGPKKPRPKRQ
jgi:DNA invertase Pin-like site-specific DNA recombinase